MLATSAIEESALQAEHESLLVAYREAKSKYEAAPSELLRREANVAMHRVLLSSVRAERDHSIFLHADGVGWIDRVREVPEEARNLSSIPRERLTANIAIQLKETYHRMHSEWATASEEAGKVESDTELWVDAYDRAEDLLRGLSLFKVPHEYRYGLYFSWWDNPETVL